jgi:hypothetical protein
MTIGGLDSAPIIPQPSGPGATNGQGQVTEGGVTSGQGQVTEGGVTSNVTILREGDTLTIYDNLGIQAPVTVSLTGELVSFGAPVLPPADDQSGLNVSVPSSGNKWLDTAIQVTLTLVLLETAKKQAENQLAEALVSRDQMVALFEKGMEIADLIMQKAEKEKEQYYALAAAGFANMALSIAGTMVSIRGAAKAYKASGETSLGKNARTAAESATDNSPVAAGEQPSFANKAYHTTKATGHEAAAAKLNQQASNLSDSGRAMTQSAAGLGDLTQNLIKASFVTQIAEADQQKAIAEAAQNVIRHAQENATQAVNDMKSVIDQLLQLAQKIADANVQNFTIRTSG